MAKWRVERGVVQQTEALVRGFYEVILSALTWFITEIYHCISRERTGSRKLKLYKEEFRVTL